ncbi:MOSC domain-containing protein [Thermaerobacter composti]|uniref:MOSC domain-containing protein n=1 Tax=Thermaerobacter composti TaxID=554949 RepID=A0ABZ0QS46_9FIRM|nr:MOSC domain-containing protein [Thermaerobacter composti]WPD19562.1 MOSC domain-containing protein [Thermaerobacter composti]
MACGWVVLLCIAPTGGAPMVTVPAVRAVAGRGLEGDRYFVGSGTWQGWPDPELTLVEEEAVVAVARELGRRLDPAALRRNVVTRGVRLVDLIGRRFRLGSVWVEGVRPCDPCGYLERQVAPGLKAALAGRGGLRARILTTGVVRVGDPVVAAEAYAGAAEAARSPSRTPSAPPPSPRGGGEEASGAG